MKNIINRDLDYSAIVENSTDIICRYDLDFKLIYCNRAIKQYFEISPEEIVGKTITEIENDMFKFMNNSFRVAFKTCANQEVERDISTIKGKKYFNTRIIPEKNEEGKVVSLLAISRDITDTKPTDFALRSYDEKFSKVFNVSPNPMMIIDMENGCFIDVNESAINKMEYSREELIGKSAINLEIVNPDSEIMLKNLLSENGSYSDFETIIKTKSGKKRIGLASGVVFEINKHIYLIQTIIDITERRLSDQELAKERILLRTMIDTLPDFIYAKDNEGKFIVANKALSSFMGNRRPEELIGKTDYIFYPKDDADKYHENELEIYRTGQPLINHEEIVIDNNGNAQWLLTTKLLMFDKKGNIIGLMGIGSNINERKKSEQALKESELKYQELYTLFRLMSDTMPDLLWAKDLNKQFIFTNKTMCEKLLIANDVLEPIGKTDLFFANRERELHPENPEWHTFGELCVDSDEITLRELKEMQFDEYGNIQGKFIYLDVHKAPLFNKEGVLIGIVGSARDITERKIAEEALRISEENYREIFNSTTEAIFIDDPLTGKMIDVNDAMLKMYGYNSKEEVISGSIGDLSANLPDYSEEAAQEYIRKALKEGPQFFEWIAKRKDGSFFWIEMTLKTTKIGGKTRIIATGRDISERKKSETALNESESRLRTLINTSPDIICFKDGKGRWLIANNSDIELFCLQGVDYYNKTDADLALFTDPIYKDAFLTCMESDEKTWNAKTISQNEEIIPCTDGTKRIYDVIKVPVFETTGERKGLVVLGRDITERKNAETERLRLQNLESLGVLAGGIAHDFNNILSTILGRATIAMDDVQDISVKNDLMAIERATKRAVSLTQQLLTFAKGGVPEKCLIQIKKIIKDTTDFCLSGSNVIAEYKFNDSLNVEADPGQIAQVIQNLVINAKQAMPAGGTIKVSTEDSEDSGQSKFVKIIIQDEGLGIPKEQHIKIFDPYFTTKQTGSGLGLSVVHSIVVRHEGRIFIESELGKGTSFIILLPGIKKEITLRETGETIIKKKLTVLVMDDEEEIRDLLSNLLLRLGHNVSVASKGEEALNIYRNAMEKGNIFDLVFMDLTVKGGMGGREAVKKLREIDPKAKVVVSSGYADSSIANYKKDGFDGALKKPYSKSELNEVISNIMS